MLCDRCLRRDGLAAAWADASPAERVELCERAGIGRRFCRDGRPPSFDDDGLRDALARDPLPSGGLYVVGPVGSHKTHLLAARCADALARGMTAFLLKWSSFVLEVRHTYKSDAGQSELDVLKRYTDLDYLAIDDLGIGREKDESDNAVRLAYELLDSRYDSAKVTDASGNLRPDEIEQRFDERIGRRLAEMCVNYPLV